MNSSFKEKIWKIKEFKIQLYSLKIIFQVLSVKNKDLYLHRWLSRRHFVKPIILKSTLSFVKLLPT